RQKDFYSFGAFFNSVPEKGLDGYKGNAVPFLQLPSPEQTKIKEDLTRYIKEKDDNVAKAQTAWEQQQKDVAEPDVVNGLKAAWSFNGDLNAPPAAIASPKLVSGKL